MDLDPDLAILDEGVVSAQLGQNLVDSMKFVGRNFVDVFKKSDSAREALKSRSDNLLEWLRDVKSDEPKLDLTGKRSFHEWLKTSTAFRWSFYFILVDSVFAEICSDIKTGKTNRMNDALHVNVGERKPAMAMLDRAKTVDDLIKIVELYVKRCNVVFDLDRQHHASGMSTYGMMLMGFSDLETTVKKIVRLAL